MMTVFLFLFLVVSNSCNQEENQPSQATIEVVREPKDIRSANAGVGQNNAKKFDIKNPYIVLLEEQEPEVSLSLTNVGSVFAKQFLKRAPGGMLARQVRTRPPSSPRNFSSSDRPQTPIFDKVELETDIFRPHGIKASLSKVTLGRDYDHWTSQVSNIVRRQYGSKRVNELWALLALNDSIGWAILRQKHFRELEDLNVLLQNAKKESYAVLVDLDDLIRVQKAQELTDRAFNNLQDQLDLGQSKFFSFPQNKSVDKLVVGLGPSGARLASGESDSTLFAGKTIGTFDADTNYNMGQNYFAMANGRTNPTDLEFKDSLVAATKASDVANANVRNLATSTAQKVEADVGIIKADAEGNLIVPIRNSEGVEVTVSTKEIELAVGLGESRSFINDINRPQITDELLKRMQESPSDGGLPALIPGQNLFKDSKAIQGKKVLVTGVGQTATASVETLLVGGSGRHIAELLDESVPRINEVRWNADPSYQSFSGSGGSHNVHSVAEVAALRNTRMSYTAKIEDAGNGRYKVSSANYIVLDEAEIPTGAQNAPFISEIFRTGKEGQLKQGDIVRVETVNGPRVVRYQETFVDDYDHIVFSAGQDPSGILSMIQEVGGPKKFSQKIDPDTGIPLYLQHQDLPGLRISGPAAIAVSREAGLDYGTRLIEILRADPIANGNRIQGSIPVQEAIHQVRTQDFSYFNPNTGFMTFLQNSLAKRWGLNTEEVKKLENILRSRKNEVLLPEYLREQLRTNGLSSKIDVNPVSGILTPK